MKKLFILLVALMVALPVMGADFTGSIDLNYFMWTPNDDTVEPQSFFGMVTSKLKATQDLGEGMKGVIKMNLDETASQGIGSSFDPFGAVDDAANVELEEIWVSKSGAFGQDALGLKFGKMEVPFNLDYDKSTSHSFSNGGGFVSNGTGVGEIDYTWGLNVSYKISDTVGTVNLTTYEAAAFGDDVDDVDLDSGLFASMAINWDTGVDVDAFGVAGLRVVVGINMQAQDTPLTADNDQGQVISLGATYALKDMGLCFGFEMLMCTDIADDAQVMCIDVDYNQDVWGVGLTYETASFDVADTTDNRMSIRAHYNLDDVNKLRFEYSSTDNADDDTLGAATIILGFFTSF